MRLLWIKHKLAHYLNNVSNVWMGDDDDDDDEVKDLVNKSKMMLWIKHKLAHYLNNMSNVWTGDDEVNEASK